MITIDVCKFNSETPENIKNIRHWKKDVGSNWPVVYILNNKKEAYVGETVSVSRRMEQHLSNPERQSLTELHIVSDESFNKSVILDLESFLIKYMASDGKYILQNGNNGIQNHEYYNKSVYQNEFKQLWDILHKNGLVNNSLDFIENSELFKYSPYKALGEEQIEVANLILTDLMQYGTNDGVSVIVQGGAGTGKTILAIYLVKLLSDASGQLSIPGVDKGRTEYYLEENEASIESIYAEECMEGLDKIGLVLPQKSLQTSVKDVFSRIKGLSKDMVLSPADVVKNFIKTGKKYDLLLVDESHRLKCRYQGHLSDYRTFDNCNKMLSLDEEYGTELDWIFLCSKNQVFFRDGLQSIRPCDIPTDDFMNIVKKYKSTYPIMSINNQWRCKGGNDYIDYLKNILACRQDAFQKIDNYDFKLFINCESMIQAIKNKDHEYGLCRVGAGFAWPWSSKKDKTADDIFIQDKAYRWNSTSDNWINSRNAINEIGCIHSLQGYDLNYAGIIIGNDIKYDPTNKTIYADKNCYFDQQGKSGVANRPEELKELLLNIYLTLLTRGIKGTYVYVCNKELETYLMQYIEVANSGQ